MKLIKRSDYENQTRSHVMPLKCEYCGVHQNVAIEIDTGTYPIFVCYTCLRDAVAELEAAS